MAFISIFLSHIGVSLFGGLGPWGVSVFLIMSGFLMMINHYDDEITPSIKKNCIFAGYKIKKLYCLHIVTLVASIPLTLGFLRQIGAFKSSISLVLNIFLLQSWIPHSKIYFSFNYVSWYLSVCLLCWILFPYIVYKIKVYYNRNTVIGMIIFLLLVLQVLLSFFASIVPNDFLGSNGFCKWFIYVFPLMRIIDFLLGCMIGLIYLHKLHCNQMPHQRIQWITVFVSVGIILSFVCFYIFFPKDDELAHTEVWWMYSCLFTALNCGFIYFVSIDNRFVSKILSTRILVWIGELSGYAFLIHQIVLRYMFVLLRKIKLDASINIVLRVLISFLMTIVISVLWRGLIIKWNTMKMKRIQDG